MCLDAIGSPSCDGYKETIHLKHDETCHLKHAMIKNQDSSYLNSPRKEWFSNSPRNMRKYKTWIYDVTQF